MSSTFELGLSCKFDEGVTLASSFVFPYRVAVTTWLDPLLGRPTPNLFTRAFTTQFRDFLARRELQLVANHPLENLGQLLLNVKFATFRAPRLSVKFTYLVDRFAIAYRDQDGQSAWAPAEQVIQDLRPGPSLRDLLGDTIIGGWTNLVDVVDSHWAELEASAANRVGSAPEDSKHA